MARRRHLTAQARNNEFESFSLAFAKRFNGDWLDRQTDNEELVIKMINSPMPRDALLAFYAERIYRSLREDRWQRTGRVTPRPASDRRRPPASGSRWDSR